MEKTEGVFLTPNSTQVPHLIIREWMPRLKDVEFRVLMVICDQTLGWVEDKETGRRKERDWIAHSQLIDKTGRADRSITRAVKVLSDTLGLIEVYNEQGVRLATSQARQKCGDKLFYRLRLRSPQPTLFDTPAKLADAKLADYKTNYLNKLAKAGKPANVKKIPTVQLLGDFKRLCEGIRGTKPIFVRWKDGNLIKAALKHLNEGQLQLLFAWFLKERRKMQATVGAALCREVIEAFIASSEREQGFYLKWENTRARYLPKAESVNHEEMAKKLKEMRAKFGLASAMPKSEVVHR